MDQTKERDDSPEKVATQVAVQLEDLRANIVDVSLLTSKLESRLGDVLIPKEEDAVPNNCVDEELVPLANQLRDTKRSLLVIGLQLESMLDRLEV